MPAFPYLRLLLFTLLILLGKAGYGTAFSFPEKPVYLSEPAQNGPSPTSSKSGKKITRTNQTLANKADSLLVSGKKLEKVFKYDSALTLFTEAHEIRKRIGPPEAEAIAVEEVAEVYTLKGKTHQALKLLLQTLTNMELANHIPGQVRMKTSIANCYEQIGDYKTSLTYLTTAYGQLQHAGLDSLAAVVAQNLANNYLHIDSFALSERYYLEAINLYLQEGDTLQASMTRGSLGTLQSRSGKVEEGYANLVMALQEAERGNFPKAQASHLNNLAIVYWQRKDWEKAEHHFRKALDIAKLMRDIESQQDIAGNLYYLHKDQHEYKESLAYLELYMQHHDTLTQESRTRQIARLQEEYEAERRTRQIQLLQKDRQLKEAKLVTSNWQRNASLAGTVLLAVLAFLLVRSSRQKQRAAALLAAQTNELNRQRIQDLLREQELVSVHSMLKGQEAERGRIAQDLHDRLGSLLATVKLHVQMAKTPEQQKLVNKLIDDACQEVRQIAHNMVSGVLMKFGLVAALQDLAHAISLSGKVHLEAYAYGLDNRLPNHMEIELYRIVQELVSNALKHAQATEITIQINRQDNTLNLLVEDNGTGFNPRAVARKTGMGLNGIEARVKQLNGEMTIDSGLGSGTTITADFPLPALAEFKPQTAPAGDFAL